MSKDDLDLSYKRLKQTIPLLFKHKVSAEPNNYSLWYTYVSSENPELNTAVDDTLEHYKSISFSRAQDLYRQHVAEPDEVGAWQLRQTIEAMLLEMSQSTKDTKSDTNGFQQFMDKCFSDLSNVEKEGYSVEEVAVLIKDLIKESQAIRQATQSFNASLNKAEKEIETLREQLATSQKQALFDSLTGLSNRRYFDSELTAFMEQESPKLCLILADIDHFKKFNDNHGHLMGDQVLKAVGKRIMQCCKQGEQGFRFGGEEFAVLVSGSSASRARQLAESIRRIIEKIQVRDKRTGKAITGITCSFGIAELKPSDHVRELIERADKYLYEAKQLGRNRVLPLS